MKISTIIGDIGKLSNSSRRLSVLLGAMKLLRAVLSLVTVVLSAKYFGTSLQRDCWILGSSFVAVGIQVLFGPINETFRTKYIHLKEGKSCDQLVDIINSVILFIVLVALLFTLAVFLFPRFYCGIVASGFSTPENDVLSKMILVLIPSLIVTELTNILSSVLNAHNSFLLPDFFGFLSLFLNIIFIICLAPILGIYSLVISSYLSSFCLLIYLYIELYKRTGYRFKPQIQFRKYVKPFIIFSIPLYINYLVSQADTLVEKNLTTHLGQGSVSLVDYARKFSDLPVNIMIGVVTTVLTPILSTHYIRRSMEDFYIETQKYFRMLTLLIIPFLSVLVAYSAEVVKVVFLHGAFLRTYVPITSDLIVCYAFGTFSVAIYIVYSQVLISQKKILLFSSIAIVGYLCRMVFNLMFYKFLGILTFAISWSVITFLMGNIMLVFSLKVYRKAVIWQAVKIYILFFILVMLSLCGRYLFVDKLLWNDGLMPVLVGFLMVSFCQIFLLFFLKFDERALIHSVLRRFFRK
ncbi:murein biosynthesis integral membrane protein MurJ [Arcticibacter tournemirensis]